MLIEQEADKWMSSELVVREALRAVEQDGIVFIDEIDKIVDGGSRIMGGNVSSEGVQRDLLPIIEGCVVSTKYGNVSTDHILFICSGAFHSSKPSDMLAELQGRLPIRVELKGLTKNDFYRILTEPKNNMIRQQQVRQSNVSRLCCSYDVLIIEVSAQTARLCGWLQDSHCLQRIPSCCCKALHSRCAQNMHVRRCCVFLYILIQLFRSCSICNT